MKWTTGKWTSYPDDGRAWVERQQNGWWVFETDSEGSIRLDTSETGVPVLPAPLNKEAFPTPEAAHRWVEDTIPARPCRFNAS